MEALHVLWKDVEGVATSRHRRDEFNLRAFANAVNLSDSLCVVAPSTTALDEAFGASASLCH